jgi:hypothetical protein
VSDAKDCLEMVRRGGIGKAECLLVDGSDIEDSSGICRVSAREMGEDIRKIWRREGEAVPAHVRTSALQQ